MGSKDLKKVGIITFHSVQNLGAALQAYALEEKIKKIGNYEVEMIDYEPEGLIGHYRLWPKFYYLRQIRQLDYLRIIKFYLLKALNYTKNKKKLNAFEEFFKEEFKSTEKYRTIEELNNNNFNFDYYIAGSDQIWNPIFEEKLKDMSPYFLSFVKNKSKKISYAASIASSKNLNILDRYKKYLIEIESISIRENDHKILVEKLSEKSVEVVLDPTLLLSKEEYSKIKRTHKKNYKYILVYSFHESETLLKVVNSIVEKTGYKVIAISKNKRKYKNYAETFHYSGPKEFLSLVEGSEYVVSDSFHGVAFSIIFNKSFYTVPPKGTGSRIIDICKNLGLDERIVNENFNHKDLKLDIDFKKVNYKLEILKEKSIKFLKDSLNGKSNEK